MEELERLINKLKEIKSSINLENIKKAYNFACKVHEGQIRESGDCYIKHPVEVALIISDIIDDEPAIIAGLLHDAIEDTQVKYSQISSMFGDEVARLIDGVTKLGKIVIQPEQQKIENLRKLFLAMAKDVRVVIIKLADRLHNMRTLNSLPQEKQKTIARETLEVFAPLAHRLGVENIKGELEDLSFRVVEPEVFVELQNKVAEKIMKRQNEIDDCIKTLQNGLNKEEIKATIQGRPKHIYSIYQKMIKTNRPAEEIYDLIAIRVIVNTIKECYAILGIVHQIWKPLKDGYDDYISKPKENMYQSIHTTVVSPSREPFEVQIRTWDMHRVAEFGFASHWRYKEKEKSDEKFEQKLYWLRQITEWQKEYKGKGEIIDKINFDLFSDKVFVFTPKGDIIDLPADSIPIDFAYKIHTDIGNRCVGVKINGKIAPLGYKLNNGDIVDILTSKSSKGPSRDWLAIVKTSEAKSRIRQYLKFML